MTVSGIAHHQVSKLSSITFSFMNIFFLHEAYAYFDTYHT